MAVNYLGALDQLLKYDIGRTAYFDVSIPTPTGLSGIKFISNINTKKLSYLCHSAELPGEAVATVAQKVYGVVEKHAIMSGYNDCTLSFYTLGSDLEEVRKTFLSWIATSTGRGEIINGGVDTTYNVAYKDDYVSQIIITQYTSAGMKLLDCTLIDAFPIAISQIPLAWSAENQAISFNVTFTYTEYKYNFYDNSAEFINNLNSPFVINNPITGTPMSSQPIQTNLNNTSLSNPFNNQTNLQSAIQNNSYNPTFTPIQ